MSVFIIRAFVRLREMALNYEKLSMKAEQLENRVSDHDEILLDLIEGMQKIIDTPRPGRKNMVGFISAKGKTKKYRVGEPVATAWTMPHDSSSLGFTMPIEIKYTDDNIGIIFCAIGRVTGKDIIKKQKEIYQSKCFVNLRYWIVDRSLCTTYEVSSEEVNKIAMMDNEAAKINPNLIMALVAESDLQYGVSRMYEAYIDETGFKTMVFRDRSAAEDWIRDELSRT